MAKVAFLVACLALVIAVGGVWTMSSRAAAAAYTERIAAQPGEQFQYRGGDIVVQPGQRIRFDNGTGCGPTLYQEGPNLVLQNTCSGQVSSLYLEPSPNPPLGAAQRTRIVLGTTTDRQCVNEYEFYTEGDYRATEAWWTYRTRPDCHLSGENLQLHRVIGPVKERRVFPYEIITWHAAEATPKMLYQAFLTHRLDRPNTVPAWRFENRHPSPNAAVGIQLTLQGPDGEIVVNTPLQVVKAGQGTRTEMWAVGADGQERIGLTVP